MESFITYFIFYMLKLHSSFFQIKYKCQKLESWPPKVPKPVFGFKKYLYTAEYNHINAPVTDFSSNVKVPKEVSHSVKAKEIWNQRNDIFLILICEREKGLSVKVNWDPLNDDDSWLVTFGWLDGIFYNSLKEKLVSQIETPQLTEDYKKKVY